jgi:hypothetical protein
MMLEIYALRKTDHFVPCGCWNISLRFVPLPATVNEYHPEKEETGSK